MLIVNSKHYTKLGMCVGRYKEINGKQVTPGETICVMEEFMPGDGTFEDNGIVRAALTGITQADLNSRVVIVKPRVKIPKRPLKGDIIYGVVQVVKDEFAIIKILGDYQGTRYHTPYTGLLHISQAVDRYLDNLYEAVRVGDIIKARILSNYPPYNLTTKDHRLGVILGFCGKCGDKLIKSGQETLKCRRCGNVEHRKISSDYGSLRVIIG